MRPSATFQADGVRQLSAMKPKSRDLRFEHASAMKRFRRFARKIVGFPKDELMAQIVRFSKQQEALKKAEIHRERVAPREESASL